MPRLVAPVPPLTDADIARFHGRVGPRTASGCLPWVGPRAGHVGTLRLGTRTHSARQVALALAGQQSSTLIYVTCDDLSCVEPTHLTSTRPDVMSLTCARGHAIVGLNAGGAQRRCRACDTAGRKVRRLSGLTPDEREAAIQHLADEAAARIAAAEKAGLTSTRYLTDKGVLR